VDGVAVVIVVSAT